MLTVVPPPDRFAEARELLDMVNLGRPSLVALAEILLPLLLAVVLLSAGCEWAGGLSLGAAVSFALSRFGPSGWPGKR